MDGHLEFEDAEILPLFERHFTAEEYEAMDQAAIKAIGVGAQAAFTVPFALAVASDAVRAEMLATAPGALKVLYRATRRPPRPPRGPRLRRRLPDHGGGGVMLERLTRTVVRRRRLVVAAWALGLAALVVVGSHYGGEHRVDYAIPGSDSAAAQDLLTERFPDAAGDTAQLVFRAADGVDDPATAAAIDEVVAEAARVDHVRGVEPAIPSQDGTTALVTVQLDATVEKVPVETARALIDLAEASDSASLTVDVGGRPVQDAEGAEAGSEQIGLVAALVILLLVFGSAVAAGLPIVAALFGVGAALATVPLLNHLFVVPDWAPQLVTMVCIGIGIDYALFVVTRFRAALADGQEPEDAVVTAMTTAGRAVVFAGGTVVVSLLGLCAMGLEYLYGTAAVMVVGVLAVLATSLTLLPALLGFAGRSIDRLRLPFLRAGSEGEGIWARWGRVVQRRPGITGAAALLLLLVVAAPVASLRFGYPDAGTGPDSLTSRRAYDAVADAFGPGANSPLVLAVDTAGDPTSVDPVVAAVAADPGVAAVLPPELSEDGSAAAVVVVPTTGPQDPATVDLVDHLRDDVLEPLAGEVTVHLGGATAASIDESAYMAPRLPVFIGAVVALSFLLLLLVFRSVLVALKAAAMNVLAIGAAYGVMALALQGGWFGGLIGIDESTPIPVWAPMMMFAILFGLSMDYEVFLLSRIREEYVRTGDNASAVATGMARTGRVITAAAAIMVTVFAAFILSDQVLVKVIGLGLSTAVLLDATVVRMVLVPSTMELLGDRNWWLPRWLDRRLPHLTIEGPEPEPVGRPGGASPVVVDLRDPVGTAVD